ncbi:hypothetical protein M513_03234 [Trichuris suis]|uniref:Uncharacterized protein n=1 Tax=Trichuris suis TaxID=68888 RepID=A0A085MEZ9_9BILA|nr:hypothetical protein M513_03234 [Trichuris suis]
MSPKSCFSSSTISGIVVLTVLATVCSVALLLYLLFGLKQGRDRYGNRLLQKLALHNNVPSAPPPSAAGAACSPVNDKTINTFTEQSTSHFPEMGTKELNFEFVCVTPMRFYWTESLRSLPNSPPPVCPSTPTEEKKEMKSDEEMKLDALHSAKSFPSADNQETFTIRATDLDHFELRLENSHCGSEVCLVPKAANTLNGTQVHSGLSVSKELSCRLDGQLKLLSISLEGLEFPTVERVLNAAQGALLVCTSHPGNVELRQMLASPVFLPRSLPSPLEHCIVDMEPLNVETPNLELLRVDCSAQVTPRLQDSISASDEPDMVSIAVQVGDELTESHLYHTAYGSDISDVSDNEEAVVSSAPYREEPNDHLAKRSVFDFPIFYRPINIGEDIALANRPEEVIKKGLSRSVPNLQEALSASPAMNSNAENVELSLQHEASENLMQALNVQEILDFIDNMNQHLTVDGNNSDGVQSTTDHQMDDEQWEQAIYATLKPTVIENEDTELSEEHQKKLNYFQEQFKQQCEELEQLGIAIKPSIPRVKA